MKRFDYSFLNERIVDSNMLSRVLHIQKFREMTENVKKRHPAIFTELEFIAKVQSVKGSNAIEGIVTSDERIEAIVNRKSEPKNHDEREIAGYRDALNIVHEGYESLNVDEPTVLRLHMILMTYLNDNRNGYKKDDNLIIKIDGRGKKSIRFRPVSVEDTKPAMEQLMLAYYEARDNGAHPLLLIPCFILDFLCIHPFSDGNGRVSRLLSLLMMYREGLDIGKYISFEEQINRSKGRYYEALRRSSDGWHENENDYIPFIEEFVGTLYLCYKDLDRRLMVVGDKKMNKSNRIEATVLNTILPISKKEICELLPDVSQTTVESVLSKMLKANRIKKIGGDRNARYIGNENSLW
jgi:Uncharacterized conserved protein